MANYNSDYYQNNDESILDYLLRLKDIRPTGMLGGGWNQEVDATGGIENVGLVDTELTDEELARLRLLRQQDQGSDDYLKPAVMPTHQQMIDQKTGRAIDPMSVAKMFGPAGGLFSAIAGSLRDNELENALEKAGYSSEQINMAMADPEYLAQQIYSGRVGDGNIEGVYRPSDAGKWSIGSLFDGLLNFGSSPAQPAISGYGAAPTLGLNQAVPFANMGQGLLTGQGQAGNRTYYVTSDGNVRDVTGRDAATQAGLKAVAAGTFDTPSWYSDDSDSGSSGSTSSSDISYSSSRDKTATTGYNFNKD